MSGRNLAVAGHVSYHGGATWRPLHPRELLADTESTLLRAAQAPGEAARRTAALLRDALDVEAADWIDARIRYVQPDDPFPYPVETPDLAAWERGGQIWALTLGTIPHETVLAHLAAQYADPQPDGPEQMRTGARDTLKALSLAETPEGADLNNLLEGVARLNRLTFGFEIGQLRALAEDAQRSIEDHLLTRLPRTAAVAASHPDPLHPAQQAARAYINRLALIGPDGEEHLRADARQSLTAALAATENTPEPTRPPPAARHRKRFPATPGN
ncbi:hypothetical protein QFZ82_000325 [Streptomyces sp. V4I23]|uniref:hypothetical protein n=1 Tax=Streptomyces sp. V4I23 TaxID=3042282 RepID=UPI002786A27D|nr:hypothetical protein [Streptomyces sp. V4I23]MDQ1005840.1 hypothetical protein [Streptomyces sp. V4I23]